MKYYLSLIFLTIFAAIPQVESAECLLEKGDEAQNFSHSKKHTVTAAKPKDFFLVSIQKSGTHLATKLLTMLTGRQPNSIPHLFLHADAATHEEVEKEFTLCKKNKQFVYHHLAGAKEQLFSHFSQTHPSYVKILQIRDLRDVFVSFVNYYDKTRPENGRIRHFLRVLFRR